MKKFLILSRLAITLASSMFAGRLSAHPGHEHSPPQVTTNGTNGASSSRDWKYPTGKIAMRGQFIGVHEGRVQVRQTNQSLVSLPISQLSPLDQQWIEHRQSEIAQINGRDLLPLAWEAITSTATDSSLLPSVDQSTLTGSLPMILAFAQPTGSRSSPKAPGIAQAFAPFADKKHVIQTRWDERFFYVESNGIPDHPLMIGITAWQQQVPIPQNYTGENAWQIPLHPVPAKNPRSTNKDFLRGAIALAVNGVPIFNPLNNRGEDAYLVGELDEFGGHCGRADDYHYHLPPVHLEKTVGPGQPIAYALDGYPIFGFQEPDGSEVKNLDQFNGHQDAEGHYHYHATKKYPYLNGGFFGEVVERGGQVDPQPRAEPIRPDLRPLRDAKISDYRQLKPGVFELTYTIHGRQGSVRYDLTVEGEVHFTFVDTAGAETTATYRRESRGTRKNDGQRGGARRTQKPTDQPLSKRPRPDHMAQKSDGKQTAEFQLTSQSIDKQGRLSIDCTCDGEKRSPAIAWKNLPAGTKTVALSLWHTAPDQEKSYWVVYNIPATTTELPENSTDIGTLGLNDRRRAEYDPMCSKGPGVKTYHLSVYALSNQLELVPQRATRANLLEAVKPFLLAEKTIDFTYERRTPRK